MYRVGSVVRTAQGLAIVRSTDEPDVEIGTELVDEDLSVLGHVVEVFGPVDRPYVAVTPADAVHLPGTIGQPVYAR